jgi:hypothetical protein
MSLGMSKALKEKKILPELNIKIIGTLWKIPKSICHILGTSYIMQILIYII